LQGKKIFSTNAEAIDKWKVWGSLDDIVMGKPTHHPLFSIFLLAPVTSLSFAKP
jgi:hypothetical protein